MPGVATSRQPKGIGFALRDALPWKALSGIVRAAEPAWYSAVFLPEISGRDALVTLGMLAGQYPADEFAELAVAVVAGVEGRVRVDQV